MGSMGTYNTSGISSRGIYERKKVSRNYTLLNNGEVDQEKIDIFPKDFVAESVGICKSWVLTPKENISVVNVNIISFIRTECII